VSQLLERLLSWSVLEQQLQLRVVHPFRLLWLSYMQSMAASVRLNAYRVPFEYVPDKTDQVQSLKEVST